MFGWSRVLMSLQTKAWTQLYALNLSNAVAKVLPEAKGNGKERAALALAARSPPLSHSLTHSLSLCVWSHWKEELPLWEPSLSSSSFSSLGSLAASVSKSVFEESHTPCTHVCVAPHCPSPTRGYKRRECTKNRYVTKTCTETPCLCELCEWCTMHVPSKFLIYGSSTMEVRLCFVRRQVIAICEASIWWKYIMNTRWVQFWREGHTYIQGILLPWHGRIF